MGLAFPATGFQVSSPADGSDDSTRTAEPRTGEPSMASPSADHSSTVFPRNETRYASCPPASCTAWPRTVAMDISSSPEGDFTTTGAACACSKESAAVATKDTVFISRLLQCDQPGFQYVLAGRPHLRHHGRVRRAFQVDPRHRRLRAFEDDVLHLLHVDVGGADD